MEPAIRVRGLVNRFGKQVVHDGLDLDIPKGKITAIVGGSGSGKSVLMRSIIGLHLPQEGTIEIFGNPIEAGHVPNIERTFGVLFQNGALFSSLTVLQNVMVPFKEHTDLSELLCEELAALKISMVGLPEEAETKRPSELSGGMKKRASLARALALDPPIIFLDEPTAGLDPIAASDFDELVKTLQQSLNLTIVIITHDLDTLFAISDTVTVLVDKRAVIDTPQNLLQSTHPWIREYFQGPRGRAAATFLKEEMAHGD